MKISTVLSCLGSVIIAELCNASVTVYLRPSTVSLGQLSGPEADVLLANHLGLESTASLDNGNLELLLENAGGQVTIGKALLDSQDDSLLVVVDADDAYLPEIIPDSWSAPAFTSALCPSSLSTLVKTYVNSALQEDFMVYSDADSEISRAPKRFLDMFDFAGNSPAVESFVKSFDALVDFVEQKDSDSRRFGAFHLTSLVGVAEEFGPESDAFQSILLALKATLSNPSLDGVNVAAIFSSSALKARRDSSAEPLQTPLPPPPGNAPIFSSSTCFTSAETCHNGTTDCSGRGQCVPVKKGPRECYVCQCAVTKDAKNRTEYWAGSACQRKDVSTAFTLITGTSIGIVLVIIFAISLLYSVGSEELPNVLTGGIAHTKRD